MLLFKGSALYTGDGFAVGDVLIEGVTVSKTGNYIPCPPDTKVIKSDNLLIIPGFVDAHVHLREPGFSYKEGIASGTTAAASAGYTDVFAMPNLDPVPDSVEHLKAQRGIISRDARVNVHPYGAITVGEKGEGLSDMDGLAPEVIAFSDDGKGVQSESLMREAMLKAKELDKIIAAHCEAEAYLNGGAVHDGKWARAHGIKGISSKSEWAEVQRDIRLAEETGCRFHVCHVSARESVELIRDAKARGVKITAETAPHYLVLCEDDLIDEGRFKMNPPLRSALDRDALTEGLRDGTIDIIATDHAPHSDEEKSRGLIGSLFGVSGLEAAFPVLYTKLVLEGRLSLDRLIDAMCVAPRRIFGLKGGAVKEGAPADLAILDLNAERMIRGEEFLSKGHSTPFEGMRVKGQNLYTILNGEIIWKNRKEN